MAWCECSNCGHHRSSHPYVGYGPYGTLSGHTGCGLCQTCGRTSSEHVYVKHQFDRCPCQTYTEAK